MKIAQILSKKYLLFKSEELSGITNLLKRSNLIKVIGPFYLIQDIKNLRTNFALDGWDLTKLALSMIKVLLLHTIDDNKTLIMANGHRLCLYQKATSK